MPPSSSSGTGGTTAGGTAPGGGTSTPSPTSDGNGGGSVVNMSGAGSEDVSRGRDVLPTSFSSTEGSSPHRRTLGLTLLGGAFLAAGAAAVRAGRRPRLKNPTASESLVFWDERLLNAVSNTIRRVSGRL